MTTPEQPSEPGHEPRQDRPSAEPQYADRAYRSPLGIASGVFLLLLACFFAGDALLRGEGRTPWLALAGLLLAAPLIVAFTIRPVVYANADRLRVRNPFRTITLPWSAVADVRAGYSSEVFTQEGATYQLWAVPVSLRKRKKAARLGARAAGEAAGSFDSDGRAAPADRAIAELREMAGAGAGRPGAQGGPEVRWAYEILAPAVAGAVLFVILKTTG
ncbi:PH domain-containing protein [Streptomyces gulbargensis]|uniref:PH domain-containing protein n=1 Tax=Streptomyces gulbargensis TaxID=364901 RepID=A0ABP7LAM5_9ACTN